MIDPLLGAIIGTVVFLAILVMGAPIFVAMIVGGTLGLYLADGLPGLSAITTEAFSSGYSFTIVAIVMFMLMGDLLVNHRLGEDLYDVVYKWFGWAPGGLAIASSIFGGLFGFMCGSGIAGVVTIGGICLPEMQKRGYDKRIALGTLALSGSLASLIPPSLLMILYVTITEASLGKLFIAGIFPGFLLVTLMVTYILLRATFNPKLIPPGPQFPWKDRFASLSKLAPVVIIFLFVIGGLYMGIWSSSEAGATGAAAALLLCLAYRRVTWSSFKNSCLHTVKTFVMIYMLLIGASIFAHLYFISGLNEAIKNAILSLHVAPWVVILIMWFILMILGCFLDAPPMVLICVPIFLPIIVSLGYDIVWFGIVIVLASEMAAITPPVGLGLFVIHSLDKEGSLMDAIRGAAPYVGLLWILMGLLIAFPQIALWLPGTMKT